MDVVEDAQGWQFELVIGHLCIQSLRILRIRIAMSAPHGCFDVYTKACLVPRSTTWLSLGERGPHGEEESCSKREHELTDGAHAPRVRRIIERHCARW